jgi:hypothetical protein
MVPGGWRSSPAQHSRDMRAYRGQIPASCRSEIPYRRVLRGQRTWNGALLPGRDHPAQKMSRECCAGLERHPPGTMGTTYTFQVFGRAAVGISGLNNADAQPFLLSCITTSGTAATSACWTATRLLSWSPCSLVIWSKSPHGDHLHFSGIWSSCRWHKRSEQRRRSALPLRLLGPTWTF